ncbi:ADL248Cp [Eremothecium gossypii ATCC 10895]|uniref:ADL248Cp n=1 Tax=Eremothecium gossypii (strain ATCC 10895 / CBS 109.51 / FGSC 9923 / NRRL Y-1056) TaxID=284811 RepID=Q75B25_EREGS|nr:ADL248Cp [Eremothecium gossypii ATCC 10895]AAS51672.2 ADL248Cp [Eremothecium gossypii ATCC 10895]
MSVREEFPTKTSEAYGFKPVFSRQLVTSFGENLPFVRYNCLAVSSKHRLFAACGAAEVVIGSLEALRQWGESGDELELVARHAAQDVVGVGFCRDVVVYATRAGELWSREVGSTGQWSQRSVGAGTVGMHCVGAYALLLRASGEVLRVHVGNGQQESIALDVCDFDARGSEVLYLERGFRLRMANVGGGEERRVELPDDMREEDTQPIAVRYLSREQALVVVGEETPDDADEVVYAHKMYVVSLQSGDARESFDILPAFGSVKRNPAYYGCTLYNLASDGRQLHVLASSCSSELTLLDDAEVLQPLQDADRAVLRINPDTDNDTSALGLALDVVTRMRVVEPCAGVDAASELPLAYVLNNLGVLECWALYQSDALKAGKLSLDATLNELIREAESISSESPEEHIQDISQSPAEPTKSSTFNAISTKSDQPDAAASPENTNIISPSPKPAFGSGRVFGTPAFGHQSMESIAPSGATMVPSHGTTFGQDTNSMQTDANPDKTEDQRHQWPSSTSHPFGVPPPGTTSNNEPHSSKSNAVTGGNTGNAPENPSSGTSTFGKPAFGSVTTPGTIFGTPGFASAKTAVSAFGQPAFGGSAFGKPVFGEGSSAEPASGEEPGKSAFGESAFGKPAFGESAFGKPAFGESAFGKPAFGESAFAKPAFGKPSFGESTATNPKSEESAFGKPAFGANAFGKPAFGESPFNKSIPGSPFAKPFGAGLPASSSPFGNLSSTPFGKISSSPFGQLSASPEAKAVSPFGKTAFSSSASPSTFGTPVFSAAQDTDQKTNKLEFGTGNSIDTSAPNSKITSPNSATQGAISSATVFPVGKATAAQHNQENFTPTPITKSHEGRKTSVSKDNADFIQNTPTKENPALSLLSLSGSLEQTVSTEGMQTAKEQLTDYSGATSEGITSEEEEDDDSSNELAASGGEDDSGEDNEESHDVDEGSVVSPSIGNNKLEDSSGISATAKSENKAEISSMKSITERIKKAANLPASSAIMNITSSPDATPDIKRVVSPFSDFTNKLNPPEANNGQAPFSFSALTKKEQESGTRREGNPEHATLSDQDSSSAKGSSRRGSIIAKENRYSSSGGAPQSAQVQKPGTSITRPSDVAISPQNSASLDSSNSLSDISSNRVSDDDQSSQPPSSDEGESESSEVPPSDPTHGSERQLSTITEESVDLPPSANVSPFATDNSVAYNSNRKMQVDSNVQTRPLQLAHKEVDAIPVTVNTFCQAAPATADKELQTDSSPELDSAINAFEGDEQYLSEQYAPRRLEKFYTEAYLADIKYTSKNPTTKAVEKTCHVINAELSTLRSNISNIGKFIDDQSKSPYPKSAESLCNVGGWRIAEAAQLMDIVKRQQATFNDTFNAIKKLDTESQLDYSSLLKSEYMLKDYYLQLNCLNKESDNVLRDLSLPQMKIRNSIRSKLVNLTSRIKELTNMIQMMKLYTVRGNNKNAAIVRKLMNDSMERGSLLEEIQSLRQEVSRLAIANTPVDEVSGALSTRDIDSTAIVKETLTLNVKHQLGEFFKSRI